MRDPEAIDAELRLLASARWVSTAQCGERLNPETSKALDELVDDLLDERLNCS